MNLVRYAGLGLVILASCGGQAGSTSPMPLAGRSVASDASGTKLVSVGSGGIWTSTDGGVSWTNQTPSGQLSTQHWTSVASDSTGMKLVAVVNGFVDRAGIPAQTGDIWTSIDGGVTWMDRTASGDAHGRAWFAVASDATRTNLVAVDALVRGSNNGDIWTSNDGGVTWIDLSTTHGPASSQPWAAVASNMSGSHVVVVGNGVVWTN